MYDNCYNLRMNSLRNHATLLRDSRGIHVLVTWSEIFTWHHSSTLHLTIRNYIARNTEIIVIGGVSFHYITYLRSINLRITTLESFQKTTLRSFDTKYPPGIFNVITIKVIGIWEIRIIRLEILETQYI